MAYIDFSYKKHRIRAQTSITFNVLVKFIFTEFSHAPKRAWSYGRVPQPDSIASFQKYILGTKTR